VQQWIMGKYPNVKTTSHASNTITKALQEEGKLTEQGGWPEIFGKGFAVAAVAKAVDRYESAEGNAPAEQPPLAAPHSADPLAQPCVDCGEDTMRRAADGTYRCQACADKRAASEPLPRQRKKTA